MDVFRLREAVANEYRDYVRSFVRGLDGRIDQYARYGLAEGDLWPRGGYPAAHDDQAQQLSPMSC